MDVAFEWRTSEAVQRICLHRSHSQEHWGESRGQIWQISSVFSASCQWFWHLVVLPSRYTWPPRCPGRARRWSISIHCAVFPRVEDEDHRFGQAKGRGIRICQPLAVPLRVPLTLSRLRLTVRTLLTVSLPAPIQVPLLVLTESPLVLPPVLSLV